MTDDTISVTDLNLFKQLMNPAGLSDETVTQMNNILSPTNHAKIEVISSSDSEPSTPKAEEEGDPQVHIDSESESESEEDSPVKAPSLFSKTMDRFNQSSKRPQTPFSQKSMSPQVPASTATPVPLRNIFKQTQFLPADFTEIDVASENKDPKIRHEKQEILFNLLKRHENESRGQWNMNIPLFELKYELSRREKYQEEQDQLEFMKEVMKIILTSIEAANEKFGPFLHLKGWSESITRNMSKYDRCLTALYRKYFRRSSMNPIIELMWLIIGSAAMWHLQNRFLGPRTSPSASDKTEEQFFSNTHDIKPPPGRVPFSQPGAPSGPGLDLGKLLRLFTR
jgi:hypothetical protein